MSETGNEAWPSVRLRGRKVLLQAYLDEKSIEYHTFCVKTGMEMVIAPYRRSELCESMSVLYRIG
jgi:hypothetical protein